MRELRPSAQMHIKPFLEDIAVASIILAVAFWMEALESAIFLAVAIAIRCPLSFFLRYGWKRPLYVIEGERLQAGPLIIDFSHRENIISVNQIGQDKIEITVRDSIPTVIDLHPLGKEDRSYLTEFISSRAEKL